MKHDVIDINSPFTLSSTTRDLSYTGAVKLIQHDHNSERITFEIPRYIDGHDLSECDDIQVHYINTDAQTKKENPGVYQVNDMRVKDGNEDKILLSWLISGNATRFVGGLRFIIRFSCTDADGNVCYVWNTAICTIISVSSGIDNGEAVVVQYADILNEWKKEIDSKEDKLPLNPSGTISNIFVATPMIGRNVDGKVLYRQELTPAKYEELLTNKDMAPYVIEENGKYWYTAPYFTKRLARNDTYSNGSSSGAYAGMLLTTNIEAKVEQGLYWNPNLPSDATDEEKIEAAKHILADCSEPTAETICVRDNNGCLVIEPARGNYQATTLKQVNELIAGSLGELETLIDKSEVL